MIRVAMLRFAIIALTCAVGVLVIVPAMGEPAPTSIQPSVTLKDAQIQDVIRLIAKAQGADVLMTDDVQGTVSLEVSQKTPEEILDLICAAKRLYWWKDHGVYVVSGKPRAASTEGKPAGAEPLPKTLRAEREQRVIPLKYFNAQDLSYLFGGAKEPQNAAYRDIMQKAIFPYGQTGQRAGIPLGPAGDNSKNKYPAGKPETAVFSRNPYEELSQVALPGVIEPAPAAPTTPGQQPTEQAAEQGYALNANAPLEHLLPEGLTPPVAFAPLNALIVQGTPEAIEEFRKLVEVLDVRVPQVMVEAQFVEMRVEDASKFGIDWSWIGAQTSIDVTGIASGGGVTASYTKGKFTALLQSLLTNNRARVINAPRLATMNNQPVTFTTSRTFFYFTQETTNQVYGAAGALVATNQVLNALPVVTTFQILPQVNGDNSITVNVTTVISDIAGFVTSPTGQQIPQPTATTLPTRLRVEDGETIVMGGFIRKNVSTSRSKVPLLSDIPIVGKLLFQGTNYSYSDSELLIFLTAYIMPEAGTTVSGATEGGQVPFMTFPLGK
jgi:type II secretory pathway component GspD/PulD (secretin)